jgi:hypothetical protein
MLEDVFIPGRAGSSVPRSVVGYWEEIQHQWLGEIELAACASLEFILPDVPSETRIITELSDSGSFSLSFFVDKDGSVHMHVAPTVRTDFAHTR